jgi:basic amino acid/polyamine antiporter, APA family
MPAPPHRTLHRGLGAVDAAALVISNVVGIGIFTTPGIVIGMVPHPLASLGLWLAGGALAYAGASAYSELAASRPRAGGEYVYLREAFGPLLAFLTGWTSFVAGFSGAVAAGAVGFATYLGRYVPMAADARPLLGVPLLVADVAVSPRSLCAIALIAALSGVHALGLGPGRVVQNGLTAAKVATLLALVGLGFVLGSGSTAHFAASGAPARPTAWLLALVPIMFTYSGWNAAAYVAEEVRDPARNLPRALGLGTAAVIALYLLLNALYLYALPAAALAGTVSAGDAAAVALFGSRGAAVLVPLILVALAGSISAMTLAGPRVYFAMARDGLFLPVAVRIHPRHRTPAAAIVAQGAWSAALVLTGTFEQLLIYTGFAVVLFSAIAVAALFVLRRTREGEERRFRAWGYPLVPGLFVAASIAMVVSAIVERPGPSLCGLGVMAAGVPLYWWLRRSG